jgi:acyl carrier protein
MKGSTSHIIATPTPKALVGSELLPVHSKVHTIASAPSIAPWQSVTAPVETEKTLKKPEAQVNSPKKNAKVDLWLKLQPVLADISGLELDEIKETDSLADIGIDSLMGMEMARDVETTFNCTLEQSELVAIVDVPGIISFLQSTLGLNDEDSSSVSSDTASSGDSPPSSQGALSSQQTSGSEGSGVAKTYVPSSEDFSLPSSTILEAFRESKALTDYFLKSYGVSGYLEGISLKQTRLCLVLTARAFKQLGCDLEAAKPGEVLQAVPCVAKHQRFHEYIYKMLEDTRIINIDDDTITRTNIPLPSQSAETILEELLGQHGDHGSSHQLAYNVGSRMADVFSGKADGPQLVFGDAKNRELVADFYGQQPFNKLYFEQMADFLTRLATKVNLSSHGDTTLRILEMGAGTGGYVFFEL